MSLRRQNSFLLNRYFLLLLVYVGASYLLPRQIPPFFQWVLMTDIERGLDFVDLEISQYRGSSLSPPLLYSLNRAHFGGRHASLPPLLYDMERAALGGRKQDEQNIGRSIAGLLSDPSLAFSLVRVRANSVSFFREKRYTSHVLTSFEGRERSAESYGR